MVSRTTRWIEARVHDNEPKGVDLVENDILTIPIVCYSVPDNGLQWNHHHPKRGRLCGESIACSFGIFVFGEEFPSKDKIPFFHRENLNLLALSGHEK